MSDTATEHPAAAVERADLVRVAFVAVAAATVWLRVWEPFAAFDLSKLQILKRSATGRRRQAEVIEQRLDLWIDEVQKRGGTAGDVYPVVVAMMRKAQSN